MMLDVELTPHRCHTCSVRSPAEPCPALEEDGFASWPATAFEKADVVGTCKPGYYSKSGANPVRMCSITGSGGNVKGWNPIQPGTECIRTRRRANAGAQALR